MRTVQLENGHLHLYTKEAEEMFELLVSTGGFWEHVSELFNNNAEKKNTSDKVTNEIQSMKTSMEYMIKAIMQIDQKFNQLPAPARQMVDEILSENIVETSFVESKSIETSADVDLKPKSTGGSSFLDSVSKFAKMGRK